MMSKHKCQRCNGPNDGVHKYCKRCVEADVADMLAERRKTGEEMRLVHGVVDAAAQLFRGLLINPGILPRASQADLVALHEARHALHQYQHKLRDNRRPEQDGESASEGNAGGALE